VKGWQFFPERPAGPVDGAYVQRRWVRPYRIGALRWLLAAGVGLVTAYAAFAGLLLVYSSQTVADVVVAGLVALLGVGALGWVTARVLSVGVWVNDAGVRVLSVTRTRQWRWADVAAVQVADDARGRPALGLVLRDGSEQPTPLVRGGLDCRSDEAFEIAAGAVQGWFDLSR
jgi:hypothetical protein